MSESLSVETKKKINKLIADVVKKYLDKSINTPKKGSGNPFVEALLKDFEPLIHRIHGLKTSMGGEMEKIAEIIAVEAWGRESVVRKSKIEIVLPKNVFQTIDAILSNLSNARNHPNYLTERKKVIDACGKPSKSLQKHKYEFDFRLYDKRKKHYYFLEMKGPDPNTTEVPGAKRRLLSAMAWGFFDLKTTKIDVFLAVYYNNKTPKPYKNYKVLNYFDPGGDLKVHSEFWNFIGRSKTTYDELVKLFEVYGKKNKKIIWEGFSKLVNKN